MTIKEHKVIDPTLAQKIVKNDSSATYAGVSIKFPAGLLSRCDVYSMHIGITRSAFIKSTITNALNNGLRIDPHTSN